MISRLTQGHTRRRHVAPNSVITWVAAVTLTLLVLALLSVALVPHAEAAPEPATSNGTIVVHTGDTLNSIAARYGVSPSTLARANGITNPNRIYIGQRLVIPGTAATATQPQTVAPASSGGIYIVQTGDTLAKIAARYHTTVSALMALNGLSNPNVIWVGQRLRVGKGGGAISPGPTTPPVSGGKGRWIDVNLSKQRLTAYQGNTPVFSTLVSTGLPGTPTVVGRFRINTKLTSTRMRGPGYDLPNVPYTMYFYKGYGLHGTYWHHNFGHPMSHGCVNLRTSDAAWLFNWASVGTPVVTHY
jgi:LysM repeat protein